MPLTQNRDVDHYIDQQIRSYPLLAGVHAYRGALLGINTGGFVRPLAAGDLLAGIAYEEMDNTNGADGQQHVRALTQGDFGLPMQGVQAADLGRPVFAVDDEGLTFHGSGHSFVGSIQSTSVNNEVVTRIATLCNPVKTVTHAVEDLGTGADVPPRAIHAVSSDGWIVGIRVVNQGTIAAGIGDSNPCVIVVSGQNGTIGAMAFNSTTPFPAVNGVADFGSLSVGKVSAGETLTLSVSNASGANPGAFLVEIDLV